MRLVGWFEIIAGLAIAGLWTMLLVTRQVPEIAEGRRDIWFHLGAELLTAVLLIVAGVALLTVGAHTASLVAALALGALLYTTVNSSGYYADLAKWDMVAMFALLTVATVMTAIVLVRSQAQ